MPHFLVLIKLRLLFLALFCLLGSLAQAQSHHAFAQAAQAAMANEECQAAMDYYLSAKEKKNKPIYTFGYAEAAHACQMLEEAAESYQAVIADFPEASFQLGMVQKGLGQYQKASINFSTYLKQNTNGLHALAARNEIINCAYTLTQKKETPYAIKNMGKKINSTYSEFAPVLQGDTLFYSSYRFTYNIDKNTPKRKLAKSVYSTQNKKGKLMRYGFNDKENFTANLCFLPDNSGVYYTQCFYQDGAKIHCDLYFRQRKKRGWKKPIKLKINNPKYTTTQPAYLFDNQSNKPYLLFSSDRKGGVGKSDIWIAEINKNHQLENPINLNIINTEGEEMTPFYDAQKQELFFSSTQHLNIGGFDIFKIKASNLLNLDGEIQPLPQPINSPANDLYYFASKDGKKGYLASNRTGAQFIDKKNKRCCNDLYEWQYTQPNEVIIQKSDSLLVVTKPKDTTLVVTIPTKPKVQKFKPIPFDTIVQTHNLKPTQPKTTPPKTKINFTKVTPKQPEAPKSKPSTMGSMLPIKLFFENDQPDNRTTATTTQKTYLETYRPYLKRRLAYVTSYCKPLSGFEQEEAALALTDFFHYEVKLGGISLITISERIKSKLQSGAGIQIVLKGYTSPRAKSHYNDFLAARRISSVKNHFLTFDNGALKPFISSGKLSFKEQPLGETKAPAHIEDRLQNRRLSIYSVEAARERRVEIIDIIENN